MPSSPSFPIGVMFAKLKLDPHLRYGRFGLMLPSSVFGTGPTKQTTTQMLMGVQTTAPSFTMFISMNIFMLAGLFFLLRYVKKIRKAPTLSPMWSEGWRQGAGDVAAEEAAMLKEVKPPRPHHPDPHHLPDAVCCNGWLPDGHRRYLPDLQADGCFMDLIHLYLLRLYRRLLLR